MAKRGRRRNRGSGEDEPAIMVINTWGKEIRVQDLG
jgi:hypothetical protein